MPLKRTLTYTLLTFYGLGTIIGAGIYALIGNVAAHAGLFTPWAFLLSSIIAAFTAASYAELSTRFPQSAGSALYVQKAFHKTWISSLVGWLVVATGVVSAATLTHGFINYLQLFFTVSSPLFIPILIIALGAIAIVGITESAIIIMIMTLIEVVGLILIIGYGRAAFYDIPNWNNYIPSFSFEPWIGIFAGAYLAFYASIGFEDMVNVAEETVNPKKTIPKALFTAILIATLLYIVVAFVLIRILPLDEFKKTTIPLTLIIKLQGHSPILFGLIALLSIMNGILVQIIMASRLIYGMAKFKGAPHLFSSIYEKTNVPLFSTLFVVIIIIILAYAFPIETLAKITSSIMLFIYSFMQFALIFIKIKRGKGKGEFSIPIAIPIIGLALTLSFIAFQIKNMI